MMLKKEIFLLSITLIYYAASAPSVSNGETSLDIREKRSAGRSGRYDGHNDRRPSVRELTEDVTDLKEDVARLKRKYGESHRVVHIRDHDDDHHDDDTIHVHLHMNDQCKQEDDQEEHLFAHCEMVDIDPEHGVNHVHGHINFEQRSHNGPVEMEVHLKGFEHHESDHAFEVHVNGDISNHCHNLGGEYDDTYEDHSRYHSKTGDLGDIHVDGNGNAFHNLSNSRLSLSGRHSIIGRSVAIHRFPHGRSDSTDIIGCCVVGKATTAHHVDHHHDPHDDEEETSKRHYAHCEMIDLDPTSHEGDHVHGSVLFEQEPNSGPVHVAVDLEGFMHEPGDHSFEIHNYGDLSDNCHNLGTPYDDESEDHTGQQGLTGDFGNIHSDAQGIARKKFVSRRISLTGEHSIIGKSLAVHHNPHNNATAADIKGCCVIGGDSPRQTQIDEAHKQYFAHCEMRDIDPEHGRDHVHGDLNFHQVGNGDVHLEVDLEGFERHAGDHAFEVHVDGDISDHCHNIGAPYDDPTEDHSGHPEATGDFGDLHSDDSGAARFNTTNSRISLHGDHSVIGKTIAVHKSGHGQESEVIGCCVIGEAEAVHHTIHHEEEKVYAGCEVHEVDPAHGVDHVFGDVDFEQNVGGGAVTIHAELHGFQHHAGDHQFEVHVNGDASDHCKHIGEPYDDPTEDHTGHPEATGDFGNLHSNSNGDVNQTMTNSRISLLGEHSIIGMSLAVHHSPHDSAGATDVVGCCVIGRRGKPSH